MYRPDTDRCEARPLADPISPQRARTPVVPLYMVLPTQVDQAEKFQQRGTLPSVYNHEDTWLKGRKELRNSKAPTLVLSFLPTQLDAIGEKSPRVSVDRLDMLRTG